MGRPQPACASGLLASVSRQELQMPGMDDQQKLDDGTEPLLLRRDAAEFA